MKKFLIALLLAGVASAGRAQITPATALSINLGTRNLQNSQGDALGFNVPGNWPAVFLSGSSLTFNSGSTLTVNSGATVNGLVSQIVAGTNVTITPSGGTGAVTINASGGVPGGSNTQLQYNNSGVFGGTSGLTWNGTNLSNSTGSIAITSNGSFTQTGNVNSVLNAFQTQNPNAGTSAGTAITLQSASTGLEIAYMGDNATSGPPSFTGGPSSQAAYIYTGPASTAPIVIGVGAAQVGRFTSTGLNNVNIGATTAGTAAFTNASTTQYFGAPSGSASAPGYAFSSALTTGIYYSAGMQFSVANSNVGAITATGLNGMAIGQTTAAAASVTTLSTTGDITAGGNLLLSSGAKEVNWGSSTYWIGTAGTNLFAVVNGSNALGITTTGTQVYGTSQLTGNVGIGGAPISSDGLAIQSSVSGNGALGLVIAPTMTATASSQNFYSGQSGGTFATTNSGYSALGGINFAIITPSVTGTSGLGVSYQLYIAAGATASTRYGIYQAGTDQNVFGGLIQAASIQNTPIGSVTPSTVAATTLSTTGKYTTYNNVATAGIGVTPVVSSQRSTGQTGAVSLTTYTVPAADSSYEVSDNVNITTYSSGTFTVTCTYTDEGNTSRTLTLNHTNTAGTIATACAAAGPFSGLPVHIRCKASTTITFATTGTFTSLTYNVEENCVQLQ